MPYLKTDWQKRVEQFPNRFKLFDSEGGLLGTFDFQKEGGNVSQAGTPFSTINMDKLEEGVRAADVRSLENQNLLGQLTPRIQETLAINIDDLIAPPIIISVVGTARTIIPFPNKNSIQVNVIPPNVPNTGAVRSDADEIILDVDAQIVSSAAQLKISNYDIPPNSNSNYLIKWTADIFASGIFVKTIDRHEISILSTSDGSDILIVKPYKAFTRSDLNALVDRDLNLPIDDLSIKWYINATTNVSYDIILDDDYYVQINVFYGSDITQSIISLDAISNVDIVNVSDGDSLNYNTATARWENGAGYDVIYDRDDINNDHGFPNGLRAGVNIGDEFPFDFTRFKYVKIWTTRKFQTTGSDFFVIDLTAKSPININYVGGNCGSLSQNFTNASNGLDMNMVHGYISAAKDKFKFLYTGYVRWNFEEIDLDGTDAIDVEVDGMLRPRTNLHDYSVYKIIGYR